MLPVAKTAQGPWRVRLASRNSLHNLTTVVLYGRSALSWGVTMRGALLFLVFQQLAGVFRHPIDSTESGSARAILRPLWHTNGDVGK